MSAGLRPFSESVWPGVRTDLFVAHESIYHFATQFAVGRDVLDAGCGTGYGSYLLATEARSVIGVDIDGSSIRFAQRKFQKENVAFRIGDLERLDFPESTFGFAMASNSMEHLSAPASFLSSLFRILRPGARALIAVPPIYSEHDIVAHRGIHYHRSNLTVFEWARLIADAKFAASGVLHRSAESPNFYSHRPSTLAIGDFSFESVLAERLITEPSITAIFVLDRPAA